MSTMRKCYLVIRNKVLSHAISMQWWKNALSYYLVNRINESVLNSGHLILEFCWEVFDFYLDTQISETLSSILIACPFLHLESD